MSGLEISSHEDTKARGFDQYTRWLCKQCGADGIDSWNKGVYDGIDWEDDDKPDNPWILGCDCAHCDRPVTVSYYGPDDVPHAIYGPYPVDHGGSVYDYEQSAFDAFANDLKAGEPLVPSIARDMDWRGGCTRLQPAPPLRESKP